MQGMKGVLGCALSHLELLENAIAADAKFTLVLEVKVYHIMFNFLQNQTICLPS
jgi:hypothetical protein